MNKNKGAIILSSSALLVAWGLYLLVGALKKNNKLVKAPKWREVKLNKTDLSSRLLVVTRIHKSSLSANMVPIAKVLKFLLECSIQTSEVLICVGIEDETSGKYLTELRAAISTQNYDFVVTVKHITPWGKFTSALNAAVVYAKMNNYALLHFMSLESRLSTESLNVLAGWLIGNEDVVVVGAVLSGHDYLRTVNEPSIQVPLRGRTCPWNTIALWRVSSLGLIGFPLIGDGDGAIEGGVEEVTAISLLQHINPRLQAVLAKIPGLEWQTKFDSDERRIWHEHKMKSKDIRPQRQMELSGIPIGSVWHV